jgi:cell division protein FtsZ
MQEGLINFNLPKNQSSIIKVIGVGGAGGNAIEHMFQEGIQGVDYIICNTDNQALERSSIPTKIQIGQSGLGAGSRPEVGRQAAIDEVEKIKDALSSNTKMLFVTAGMGGGTGTGAAPVVAQIAQQLGILTVGIVTTPYKFEGPKRRERAELGIVELQKYVDALIVISNDKLRELYGDTPVTKAFAIADDILTIAARSIAEIITVATSINLDFEDVNTVMRNSGRVLMGYGKASGENRAIDAISMALESPLLNDNSIKGTNKILLYILSNEENELTQDEIDIICETVQEEAGNGVDLFFGYSLDENLDCDVSITLIATGINGSGNQKKQVQSTDLYSSDLGSNPFGSFNNDDLGRSSLNNNFDDNFISNNFENHTFEEDSFNGNSYINNGFANVKGINNSQIGNNLYENDIDSFFNNASFRPEIESSNKDDSVNVLNDPPIEQFSAEDIERTIHNNLDAKEKKYDDRLSKLRSLSLDIELTPEKVDLYEKEPAYKRSRVILEEVTPSDEVLVSGTTLDKNNDLVKNKANSYIYPTVD